MKTSTSNDTSQRLESVAEANPAENFRDPRLQELPKYDGSGRKRAWNNIAIDLTGKRFGRWIVIGYAGASCRTKWLCRCDCGIEREVFGNSLTRGLTASCGCKKHEDFVAFRSKQMATRHGHKASGLTSPEYSSWLSMKYRCTNAKAPEFSNYGGRGITICQRWLDSFQDFLFDMGPRPSLAHSLGRIDNDGNYEPSNCRWETREQQSNNKRDSFFIEHEGERLTSVQWARKSGISDQVLRKRFNRGLRGGALFSPVKPIPAGFLKRINRNRKCH